MNNNEQKAELPTEAGIDTITVLAADAAERKLYYEFSDGADVCRVVMTLSGVMEWIKADEDEVSDIVDERYYTIVPKWLTDEEFNNLPEADI